MAAHCHARQPTQSKFRATQLPITTPTPGTEPPYPRFAAHLRCVSAKEGKGSQEGTGNHTVSCPLLPQPPGGGNARLPIGSQSRLQRRTAVSAEGIPSADGKKSFACGGKPPDRRKVYPQQRVKRESVTPTSPRPPGSTRPSPVCHSEPPAFSSACRPQAAFPSCPRRRRDTRATHSRGSSRR